MGGMENYSILTNVTFYKFSIISFGYFFTL